MNEGVHGAAFGLLASIAGVAGDAVVDTLTARSPTKAKTRAIGDATRELQNERAGLHTTNRTLQAENEAIKASRASLAREHDALRTITAKRAAAVKAVATRTSIILAARSADAVSSLPMRAAPYIGIAALVGFTTVELKADCDLARSLADLNADHGNEPIDTGQICRAVDKVPSPQQAWTTVRSQASATLKTTYSTLESAATLLGLTIY